MAYQSETSEGNQSETSEGRTMTHEEALCTLQGRTGLENIKEMPSLTILIYAWLKELLWNSMLMRKLFQLNTHSLDGAVFEKNNA